ncbi:TetR/AcrR family transcriptional regulator [Bacillus marasmi]|uniref:TetR/AcrR family transcriptional regulator n=1 Tax=Bacillus marasmi TaxID=1926279 RepID=UPI0011C8D038|nr:TetR/AcrR family transcriptional regulator [Bacillus marasmi]
MNDRKQHVINKSHELFIDKGFQATSIQDILDYSGISKGTFYNYFSSKNELLIALFMSIYKKLEKDRNELLIGHSPTDIEVFIKQVELQMNTCHANNVASLIKEVSSSNDLEMKQYIRLGNLKFISWYYYRFIDLFGERQREHLLDCAIMFMGLLTSNLKYFAMANEQNAHGGIYHVVKYSVERIQCMVKDVSQNEKPLFPPDLLEVWLPECKNCKEHFQKKLYHSILELKKGISIEENIPKLAQLLDFVQDELLSSQNPRKFLIESTLDSLRLEQGDSETWHDELKRLEQLISDYLS